VPPRHLILSDFGTRQTELRGFIKVFLIMSIYLCTAGRSIGIPSCIGYLALHPLHIRPFLSLLYPRPDLHAGHARTLSRPSLSGSFFVILLSLIRPVLLIFIVFGASHI